MTTAWEFIGEYRPGLFGERRWRPLAGVTFSGWALRASCEVAVTQQQWRLLVDDTEITLVLDDDEADFLAKCQTWHLECWTTGQLLLVRGERFLVPEVYGVFSTRGLVATVPPSVASRVAETALLRALEVLWRPRCPEEVPTLCYQGHPLASVALGARARALTDAGELAAALFVAHAEAATRSRSAVFHGQDAARLGSSRFLYRREDESVRVGLDPSMQPGEVVRGCLLVAERPASLLRVARAVLDDGPRLARLDCGDGTLVVALREDLPFVLAALGEAADARLLTNASELEAVPPGDGGLFLVAAELLANDLELCPTFAARRWDRLVTVGWPHASHMALVSSTRVSFVFHLALAVYAEFGAQDDGCLRDYEAVAHLLGVAPAGLNDPAALRAALQQRVMHLQAQSGGGGGGGREARRIRASPPPALRYVSVPLEDVGGPAEEAALGSYRGAKRRKRLLYGTLCGHQRPCFPPLPAQQTAAQHFQRQQPSQRLDAYATANLQATGGVGEPPADCPVCFEPDAPVVTRCGHHFCEACLELAFAVQPRCPSCRRPLHRQRDVVHTRPEARGAGTAFMRQLRGLLFAGEGGGGGGRTLVVSSHGDLHERLAAWFRAEGTAEAWAWRGNARQLVRTLQRFERCERGALLVDPGALSLSWARWPPVTRVIVVWPLEGDADAEPCCQLREVLRALPEAAPPPLLLLLSTETSSSSPLVCYHAEFGLDPELLPVALQ
jgi:hypothetical protein